MYLSLGYGAVAQLARAFGSYPKGRVFESHRRYQVGIKECFMTLFFYIVPILVKSNYLAINKKRDLNSGSCPCIC